MVRAEVVLFELSATAVTETGGRPVPLPGAVGAAAGRKETLAGGLALDLGGDDPGGDRDDPTEIESSPVVVESPDGQALVIVGYDVHNAAGVVAGSLACAATISSARSARRFGPT